MKLISNLKIGAQNSKHLRFSVCDMEEFCPLCMKKGLKKKMKAIQINLEEAVWMCESEKCTWPMEYKELEYIPRQIGESWSCYWHNYKPNRPPVTESQSEWESFFTPPYTPKTEVSPALSSDTSIHNNNGVNRSYNAYSKVSEGSCSSKESTTTSNSTTDHTMDIAENSRIVSENNISNLLPTYNDNELMNISNSADLNQFSINRLETCSLESINLETEATVNCQRNLDSINSTTSSKSIDTGIPTIVSIEKANLICVKSINANQQISQHEPVVDSKTQEVCQQRISNMSQTNQISNKNSVQNSSPENPALLTETEKLQSNDSVKIDEKICNPSVEVRTVEIVGLPPVTVRYEVPTFLQKTGNVEVKQSTEVMPEPKLAVSKKIEDERGNQPILKKTVMTGKMYKSFSLTELRKAKSLQKSGVNEAPVSNSSKNNLNIKKPVNSIIEVNSVSETTKSENILEVQTDTFDQNLLPETIKSITGVSHNSERPELTNSTNCNREFPDSESSRDNVISDLDSFLNDFIEENNVNMTDNTSLRVLPNVDDWLSSLLT